MSRPVLLPAANISTVTKIACRRMPAQLTVHEPHALQPQHLLLDTCVRGAYWVDHNNCMRGVHGVRVGRPRGQKVEAGGLPAGG